MTLKELNTLLSYKELKNDFLDTSSLLKKRIFENDIVSFETGENSYPPDHFLEICVSRLELIRKKKLKEPPGLEKTTMVLNHCNDEIRIGYAISRKKEKFALLFQKNLKRLVAIYCNDYIEPIVLDSSSAVKQV